MSKPNETRRTVLKAGAYVAPAILTLAATPSYAKSGSEKPDKGKPPKQPKPSQKSLTG
jgi:hypothetical protein